MVGTRGVPARYGGFETCIEEVGKRLVERNHEVRVYCRGAAEAGDSYLGMSLVHRPALKKKSLETLSHTALSVQHLLAHRTDVALVFNAANSPFLPLLRARGIPVATHVDGLEWKRAKWGRNGRHYYRAAEALSVRWSDALIADAQGIADYYIDEFSAKTELISYGAPILTGTATDKLGTLDLTPGNFHLAVARLEPENHVAEIVRGYVASKATTPLVVVGSAPYADAYTAAIREAADSRVQLVGGVWDQELLDQLYAHCTTYLHGHSVGGTNPSLLRAIGAGAATIAFDVSFNREVIGEAGRFFTDEDSVAAQIEYAEANPEVISELGTIAQNRAQTYNWDEVADAYEALCERLIFTGGSTNRPSGRRTLA